MNITSNVCNFVFFGTVSTTTILTLLPKLSLWRLEFALSISWAVRSWARGDVGLKSSAAARPWGNVYMRLCARVYYLVALPPSTIPAREFGWADSQESVAWEQGARCREGTGWERKETISRSREKERESQSACVYTHEREHARQRERARESVRKRLTKRAAVGLSRITFWADLKIPLTGIGYWRNSSACFCTQCSTLGSKIHVWWFVNSCMFAYMWCTFCEHRKADFGTQVDAHTTCVLPAYVTVLLDSLNWKPMPAWLELHFVTYMGWDPLLSGDIEAEKDVPKLLCWRKEMDRTCCHKVVSQWWHVRVRKQMVHAKNVGPTFVPAKLCVVYRNYRGFSLNNLWSRTGRHAAPTDDDATRDFLIGVKGDAAAASVRSTVHWSPPDSRTSASCSPDGSYMSSAFPLHHRFSPSCWVDAQIHCLCTSQINTGCQSWQCH